MKCQNEEESSIYIFPSATLSYKFDQIHSEDCLQLILSHFSWNSTSIALWCMYVHVFKYLVYCSLYSVCSVILSYLQRKRTFIEKIIKGLIGNCLEAVTLSNVCTKRSRCLIGGTNCDGSKDLFLSEDTHYTYT